MKGTDASERIPERDVSGKKGLMQASESQSETCLAKGTDASERVPERDVSGKRD